MTIAKWKVDGETVKFVMLVIACVGGSGGASWAVKDGRSAELAAQVRETELAIAALKPEIAALVKITERLERTLDRLLESKGGGE